MSEHVSVVGAGLVGSLISTLLARRGYEVDLYERRPDDRATHAVDPSRSINLALSARGLHALRAIGLDGEALQHSVSMPGRVIHDSRGQVEFQPYGIYPHEHLNSISRAWLDGRLKDAAESAGVRIHFGWSACGEDSVRSPSGEVRKLDTVVLGTDGAYSAVRYPMIAHHNVNYSQDYLAYAYKELSLPAGPGGSYQIEKNGLHIWPRTDFMLIALPDEAGTFTATLFCPWTMLDGLEPLAFFREHFPDVEPLFPDLAEQWATHAPGPLVTVRMSPWYRGRTLLMGDAAHAIVPFFGQGMNAGFEDCDVFMQLLDELGPDWPKFFPRFEQLRRTNLDAIADMALENLTEMQGKTDDPQFLLRKAVEKVLEREFPQEYISRYSLVSHHRVPYRTCFDIGVIQQQLLLDLCQGLTDPSQVDLKRAHQLISDRLGAQMASIQGDLEGTPVQTQTAAQ